MKTPFLIYIKAVGIYALLTMPALFLPVMYLISMVYVLMYGWFAWALFTLIYVITISFNPGYATKMVFLLIGVVAAVAFAFQMLQVLNVERDVWHSESFLLFPLAAVISGWISLFLNSQKIEDANRNLLLDFPEAYNETRQG